MAIIYNLLFIIFSFIYLPYLIFRRKSKAGFLRRFGILEKGTIEKLKGKHPIWLHAVSVGEIIAASNLIKQIRQRYPEKGLVVSTITPTGNLLARKFVQNDDVVLYLPLDLSFIVRRLVNLINPVIFITVETEIWPNLFLFLGKKNIPIALINGRISLSSFKGYKIFNFIFRSIFEKVSLFCMQSKLDAERIIALGARRPLVKITGNTKFDIDDSSDFKSDYTDYKIKLGLESDCMFFVAGSTHAPEEEIILKTYKRLLANFPNLILLIAPRHIERVDKIESILSKEDLKSIRFSKIKNGKFQQEGQFVIILDTIGDLKRLYNLADLVFIGGSLVNRGGQNIIEPAVFSKAIVFGPHMHNFQGIVDTFLENNAAVMINDARELYEVLSRLLSDNDERKLLGERAEILVRKNRGATSKNLEEICRLLKDSAQ